MKTLYERFRGQVEFAPGSMAIETPDKQWTHEFLLRCANGVAALLSESGLPLGERVLLLLKNSPEYVACYLGVLQSGGVVVAFSPDTTPAELGFVIGHAAPITVFADRSGMSVLAESLSHAGACSVRQVVVTDASEHRQFADTIQVESWADVMSRPANDESVAASLDAPCQIIYTSGTTGQPKGVTLSHSNIAANCSSIVQYLTLTRDDSILVTLPFFYSYGNSLLFTHLAVGGRLVLATDFVFWNRVLDLMEQKEVTGYSGVPSSFAMFLHRSNFAKREFPRLRYLTCAGGALASSVADQLRAVVPHADLFLMYGQTEATARLSSLMPEDIDRKMGSIGRGIPGVQLQVLNDEHAPVRPGEVGEIVAQGDNVMVGYWNDPHGSRDVLRSEGLRTGDLATVDDDGYIYIVGRRNDMIKHGAHRIHPQELEEVLLQCRGVAEVAVVGVEDEVWGEVPVAYIVPAQPADPPEIKDLVAHCQKVLPRFKVVREVRFVETLPKTASGKVVRAALRQGATGQSQNLLERLGHER